MMKTRGLAAVLSAVMSVAVFAGCSSGAPAESSSVSSAPSVASESSSSGAASPEASSQSGSTAPSETSSASEAAPSSSEAAESEAASAAGKTVIRLAAMKGPTAMGLVKLLEDSAAESAKNEYAFQLAGTADEIVPLLTKGELDMAAVPCNLASVLYNNTKGQVKLAAVNTLGVLYIVETGDTVKTVEDLRGKTIYTTGKGTTPEYALNYILTKNGLDPAKDVTIEYKSEATEVAAQMAAAEDAIAMLPEPYVTTLKTKNDKVRTALDMTAEWEKVGGGSTLVTGVVVVRSEFLEQNKAAVDQFLDEYQASIDYVNANVADAAQLVGKYDIAPAAVAEKAIPNCNLHFLEGAEMKTKVAGYLQTLFDQNPKAVGGQMPDDAFYYQR